MWPKRKRCSPFSRSVPFFPMSAQDKMLRTVTALASTPSAQKFEAKRTVRFASWGEYLTFAEKTPPENAVAKASRDGDDVWAGGTFEDAIKLARFGWDSAEAEIRRLSDVIVDRMCQLIERQEIVYDVEGMAIDIGVFMQGEPECWQRIETRITEGAGRKIVRLVVNGFVSNGISQDVIIRRGVVLAALVQLLEYAGNRVEIIWWCPFKHRDGRADAFSELDVIVPIKAADQELDMGRMVYALAHPTMFRRISFSVLEQHPEAHENSRYYGQPFEIHPDIHKADVYVGCTGWGEPQWHDTDAAQEWIVEQLKKQGVQVRQEEV